MNPQSKPKKNMQLSDYGAILLEEVYPLLPNNTKTSVVEEGLELVAEKYQLNEELTQARTKTIKLKKEG